LYATDFSNNLYTINSATGKATLVGVTGIPAVPFVPAATNPDGSFNFYDENLFGVAGKLYANFDAATFNPASSVFTTVISPALYQIDDNTGHASKVASTDLGLVTITNLNGTIYGFSGMNNQVVTLNVTNGTTSFVSNIDPSAGLIGGAAPAIPEPASIALAGIGLAGVVLYTRRRRHL
jgi:PEP-CTERM motif-containing protein